MGEPSGANDIPWIGDRFAEHIASELEALAAPYTEPVEFVPLDQFVNQHEELPEPLLGTQEETLLPADGMILMYGDGGAGKTTLTIDAVAHIASGTPWLGLETPRPARITMIENEGPRGKFRQVLGEKSANWTGAQFTHNVTILEEPWTRFTLLEDEHRQALAQHITDHEIDIVVMGPLVTLGTVGSGTPEEITAFDRLMVAVRTLTTRKFAFWVVHHENKAGDVSGAWERVPDTLVHIQARGNGHTGLVWRKARWSSENHGKSIDLEWTEGRSFSLVEKQERDPWQEMTDAFRHVNGWRTAKESGKLITISEEQAKKVLAELVRRGVFEYAEGPQGRGATAKCWRFKDDIEGALDTSAHLSAPSSKTPVGEEVRGCAPPVRGAAHASAPTHGSATALDHLSAPPEDPHPDIPF